MNSGISAGYQGTISSKVVYVLNIHLILLVSKGGSMSTGVTAALLSSVARALSVFSVKSFFPQRRTCAKQTSWVFLLPSEKPGVTQQRT